ncbi:putative protein-serine/threonine kinase [Helianthus annuus]|nr:putative protein-serine/threonine kinase [Helianthus annuus]
MINRPPELLLGTTHYGFGADLWGARCILGELYAGMPIMLGWTKTLLAIDPEERGTATLVLKSEFFTTKPLACDRSSLLEYPPSKEIVAKRREEEAKSYVHLSDI